FERRRRGHEEEGREALPSRAGIRPRIGKDQPLGRLAQRTVEEPPRFEQAILRRGEGGRRLVLGRGERLGVEERELAAVRAGARAGSPRRGGRGPRGPPPLPPGRARGRPTYRRRPRGARTTPATWPRRSDPRGFGPAPPPPRGAPRPPRPPAGGAARDRPRAR